MSFGWQCYVRGRAPSLVSLVSILSTLSPGKVPDRQNPNGQARSPVLRFGRLAGMLEQEVQRLVRLDVAGDAAQRAILLEFHVHRGHRLALLAGDLFDFGVDFVAGGVNALALADLAEQDGSLDLADGLVALRFLHLFPIQLEFARIDALLGRSEEHTSELQSLRHLVCRLLLYKNML